MKQSFTIAALLALGAAFVPQAVAAQMTDQATPAPPYTSRGADAVQSATATPSPYFGASPAPNQRPVATTTTQGSGGYWGLLGLLGLFGLLGLRSRTTIT